MCIDDAESGLLQNRLPHVIISKLCPSLVLNLRSILASEQPKKEMKKLKII